MNSLICVALAMLSLSQLLVSAAGGLAGGGGGHKGIMNKERPQGVPHARPVVATTGPAADIAVACSMAKDKPFCLKSLQEIPSSKGADMARLASLALQAAQAKGMEVSDSLDDMLQDEETLPQDLNEALNDCSDQYSEALAHLEDSLNGLSYNPVPFNDMRTWLAGTISSAEVCQRGMLDVNPKNRRDSHLLNDAFAKLCDNVLSVVTVMQAGALRSGQAKTLS